MITKSAALMLFLTAAMLPATFAQASVNISVKNSNDVKATGGSATANQSQNQSQSQTQSSNNSISTSSQSSQSQQQAQTQSQSVSATGGNASVDQKTKVNVEVGGGGNGEIGKIDINVKKDNHDSNNKVSVRINGERRVVTIGNKRLPITGSGTNGLIALAVLSAFGAIYAVKKFSAKAAK